MRISLFHLTSIKIVVMEIAAKRFTAYNTHVEHSAAKLVRSGLNGDAKGTKVILRHNASTIATSFIRKT